MPEKTSILQQLDHIRDLQASIRRTFELSKCWKAIVDHIKKNPQKSAFADEDDISMLECDIVPSEFSINKIDRIGIDHIQVKFVIYWKEDEYANPFQKEHTLRIPSRLVDDFSEEEFQLWLKTHRKTQEFHLLKNILRRISFYLKGSDCEREEFLGGLKKTIQDYFSTPAVK